jgi:hypothetical protein
MACQVAMGAVVLRVRQQRRVECRTARQALFLRAGAIQEAAARPPARCES